MSEARDATGRFQPGCSGNPTGRQKGSKNRATLWAEAMRNGDAEAVLQAVIERAKQGDVMAQRFVAQRTAPRERCIILDLPEPTGAPAQDLRAAFRAVRAALVAGEISIGEAGKLMAFFTQGQEIEDAAIAEERREEERRAEAEPRVEVEERRRALEEAARDATDRLAGRMPIPGAVPAEAPADQAAALQTPVRNGTIRGFIPAGTRW